VKRLLIVDDDADILASLEFVLAERYAVDVATNGQEALRLLGERRYDALVLDLMMPVMSGTALLDHLATHGLRLPPVVVMSAGSDGAAHAARAGVRTYLAKPFDVHALEATLERLIGGAAAAGTAS
jgi:two-component system, OmpR family, response regulator